MKKLISERVALNGLLILLSIFLLFHGLVMLNVVPFGLVWGGKMKNRSQMLTLETVSILINTLMLVVSGIKAGYLLNGINQKLLRVCLWAMFAIFVMNTLGNLFSVNPFEKIVFTPVTLALSLFTLRVAMIKGEKFDL